MAISPYIPLCDAIVQLFSPLVEVVIHDIESDLIVYINGSLSVRQVGDSALLDKEDLNTLDQIVYPKINFDGRLVKSISVRLEDKWVLCLNCDVSIFSALQGLSSALLKGTSNAQPKSLFQNDWQEKVHVSVHEYLQQHHLSFDHLTNAHKKRLVLHLLSLGAFQEKNAADYVAKVLNLGRATVFKYLKEGKQS